MGEGSEIFRLSLEDGQFMAPLTSVSSSVNCIDAAMMTQLIATGGEDGMVEIWDPRTRTSSATLDCCATAGEAQHPVRDTAQRRGCVLPLSAPALRVVSACHCPHLKPP